MAVPVRGLGSKVIFCAVFCAQTGTGLAQTANQTDRDAASLAGITEITVTAEKREQQAQSVGITMSVFSQQELESRAYRKLPEVSAAVSNTELFEDYTSAGIPTWIIRGVGLQDFNTNNTPTASVFVDEVYQTSTIMGDAGLFDIGQVEILKGPQGGLYGRNTTGGAVRLNTNHASLDGNSGRVNLSYGNWNYRALEAMVNLTNSDDKAWRLAGRYQGRGDAWQRSLANSSRHGKQDIWDLRSWFRFEPSGNLDIEWKIQGGENTSDIPLGRSIGFYNSSAGFCDSILTGQRDDATCLDWAAVNELIQSQPQVNFVDQQSNDGSLVLSEPINRQNNDYLSNLVIVNAPIGNVDFSSITAFDQYNYGVALDLDGSIGEYAHRYSSSDVKVVSQEFRLLSDDSGPLSWLAGLVFSEERFKERRQFFFRDNFLVIQNIGLSFGNIDYDQNTSSHALYGGLRYAFNDDWALNLSGRYTDENKEYRNGNLYVPGTTPFYIFSNLQRDYSLHHHFSGNARLDWMPMDDLLVYFSIADGFKSGGFYGGFPSYPQEIDPYREEGIIAYELGFKHDSQNRKLRLNGSMFYYDYSDVQGFVSRLNGLTSTLFNVLANQGSAVHTGAEFDLTWLPVDPLRLSLSMGYLDAHYSDDGISTLDITGTPVPIAGRRPYAPMWSGAASAIYEFPVSDGLRGRGAFYYDYRSDFSGHQPNKIEEAINHLDGYGLLNGSVDVYPGDKRWQASLWIKNMLDKTYRTRVKSDGLQSYIELYGEPRSYGISLEFEW